MDAITWRGVWARIADHTLDDIDADRPFSARLAAENGWDEAYAQRCIEEYRRFALLSVITGHAVTPSDAVDQVWHLHLTYTEDYWDTFCKHVLRRPLHHRPLRGGRAERLQREEAYARTLASYRQTFGERPPRDIWPTACERLSETAAHVRIDVRRTVVLPRPSLHVPLRALRRVRDQVLASDVAYFVAAASLTLLTGTALVGRNFLAVYAVFAALVLLTARPLTTLLIGPRLRDDEPLPDLDPYALAVLAGGRERLLEVALAKLVGRGVLVIEHGLVCLRDVRSMGEHPVEQALLAPLTETEGGVASLAALREALSESTESLTRMLVHEQLLAPEWMRMLPVVVGLTVPSVGLGRVLFGLVHARPIGWIALLALSALAIACVLYGPQQTPRGKAVLEEHAQLAARVRPTSGPLSASALATVAVCGPEALLGTPLARVVDELMEVRDGEDEGYTGARVGFGS